MTIHKFYLPASDDATLTIDLPEELRGEPLKIVVAKEPAQTKDVEISVDDFLRQYTGILKDCGIADFGQKKSLDEIIAEQGGSRTCTNPTNLSEGFPKLWDSESELEEFLERRKY